MTETSWAGAPLSAALAAFIDVLLPGKGDWPSGATLGVQHPVMERLVALGGEEQLDGLSATLTRIGAPFDGMEAAERTAAVASMEVEDPVRFQWLRTAAFQAYYENPSVVALIDARGTPYRKRPHVQGYDLPKFDVESQRPMHGRGHYIPTDAVRPVDISGLKLDMEVTAKWGMKR